MKNYLLLFLCLFLSITFLSAQKKKQKPEQIDKCVGAAPSIRIPSSMCIGECVIVYAGYSSALLSDYTVETPSGDILEFTIDFYDFCPTELGSYTFDVYLPGESFQPITKTITVTDFFIPMLTTNSISCIANELGEEEGNNCQQVCAGTTVIYTAGNSQGLNLVWDINGAEDFQIEDNQAVVIWGSEGYGHVNISVEEVPAPLNINCQVTVAPTDILVENGQAIVYIEGGEAPFEIIIDAPNGEVVQWEGGYGINTLTILPVGFYNVLVISADGQESTCSFQLIAAEPGSVDCQAFPIVYITTQETDEDCYFEWTANVQGGIAPYTFIWSNGQAIATFLGTEGLNSVTVTDANGCNNTFFGRTNCTPSCMGSNEVCIEILPEPIANFSASVPIENGVIEICSGQPLSFFNESLHTNTYYWNFTLWEGSSAIHPEFTYEAAGTYDLSLIAFNDCYCNDTISVSVVVSDAKVPPISCQGTICQGDISTYYTPAGCDTYEWVISNNGLILNGGTTQDTFVQVEWLNGTVGNVSLSTPACSASSCPEPNVIQIPIIGEGGIITGPDSVCPFEQVEFRIPAYSGTTLSWSISEGGIIRGAVDEPQINAYWETSEISDSLWVSISYDNCFLGCGGSDTLWLSIRPNFHLEGLTEWCENQDIQYKALTDATADSILSHWQVQDMEGLVIWQSTSPVYSMNESLNLLPGNYRVQATPDVASNYCETSASLPFRIIAAPLPPDGIIGLEIICPGSTYEYFADGNLNTHRFRWYIQSGGSMSVQEGANVFISWGDVGPYQLELTQIPLNGLPCESLPVSRAC